MNKLNLSIHEQWLLELLKKHIYKNGYQEIIDIYNIVYCEKISTLEAVKKYNWLFN